jgi:hypothetical protein
LISINRGGSRRIKLSAKVEWPVHGLSTNGAGPSLDAKVSFLNRPDAYRPAPGEVVCRETHMSWVFLVGDRVYKLKKPVRFSYLDFSTLARREAACRAELRLNRALAPDIYLDVLPLIDTGAGLSIGGTGTPVDWLVVMRRLDERRMLDSLIADRDFGGIDADVEQHLGAVVAPPEKKRAPGLDLDAMRTAIAAAMARSKREIPHYYLEHQVDVTACEHWLAQRNATLSPDTRLLFGALPIKAVALAARRYPAFNGFYRDNKFEPAQGVHVGVAIAIRGGGLTAPALHDADQLSLDELMSRMRDLIQRTRAGRIRGSEMSDPTITVSSLGERGVEALYGIIYPPQVAIVGIGKVVTRPWVIDGAIGPRSVITMTLTATIGSPTGTRAHCSWPRSANSCRSRKSYE